MIDCFRKSLKIWKAASFWMVILLSFSAVGQASVKVGETAPEFLLQDTLGNSQSLSAQKGKWVVLEWTNYDCPFVRKHYGSGNMQRLQAAYGAKGVVWFSVNSSGPGKQGNYSPAQWNELAREKGAKPAAILLDSEGKVGKLYGAQTTPHLFVIDPEGILIYQGAIDDRSGTNPSDIAQARNYVQAALDQAMAGKKVENPVTKSYGCSVKYAD